MSHPAPSFKMLENVDSTNNYAMAKVHEAVANHGDAFCSFSQTSGKGQREKSWYTGNHKNIALSIVIKPDALTLAGQFYLTAATAVGCREFFSKYARSETKIKWPNDIYWRDRKAGGILIETVSRGNDWKWAVIGIGMNINQEQFVNDLRNPVSLKQITGKDFDLPGLAKELHLAVLKKVNELKDLSLEKILEEYHQHLYKLNEPVQLKSKDNKFITGVIKRVDTDGKLIILSDKEEKFQFGEVEWQ